MVTVFIWSFRGKTEAWGHASMQADQTYMSWWPETPGQVPSKIHSNIYGSHPFRYRTYLEDVSAERQEPDHIIRINGLEENAIKDWWQSFGLMRDGIQFLGPLLSWETLSRNCSTVVATGLKKGGGDKYADWSKSLNIVWTPKDILHYALNIQKNIAKKNISN